MKLTISLFILLTPCFLYAQFINNGATIVMTTGSSLVMQDISLQNNGTFDQTAGTVLFNGTAINTVSGTVAPSFYVIQLNKTAGTLQLQTSINVHNQLQFVNGLLNLNANNILLDPAATVAGETETSHVYGTAGYVQIVLPLNAPSLVNPGNLGAVITSTQNLGPTTVRSGHQSQVNGSGSGNSILRYYDIIPANNTSLSATLRINYLDAELNGLSESQLTLWKSDNNTTWTDLGRTSNSTATNFVEHTAINNLTRFTLSTIGNALPLTWGSFNTRCVSGFAELTWKTEQEMNTSLFLIYRSVDGRNWTLIGTLPAAGNSIAPITYTYDDQQLSQGVTYYQVQSKDFDGRITDSPVLTNTCGSSENMLKVFPNPVFASCWVSIQSTVSGPVSLQLYDGKGSLVRQIKETIRNGNNQFELQMTGLASGIYSLRVVKQDGSVESVKIEKQ